MRSTVTMALLASAVSLALPACGGAEGPKADATTQAAAGAAPSTGVSVAGDPTIRLRYYDMRDLLGEGGLAETDLRRVIEGLAPSAQGVDVKNGIMIVRAPAVELDAVQAHVTELRTRAGVAVSPGPGAPPPPPPVIKLPEPR